MHDTSTAGRRGLRVGILLAFVPVCLCLGAGLWAWRIRTQPALRIRIATGPEGGTYLPLGQGIAEALNARIPDLVHAEALATIGSPDNVGRLERGEVELAFAQSDTEGTPGNPRELRSIAILYKEVLHVLVRRRPGEAPPSTFADLDRLARPLAIGAAGSGTEALVRALLVHFGLEALPTRSLGTKDAVLAFEAGTVDAVCLVSGLRSPVAQKLLARGDVALLPLGSLTEGSVIDGIRVELPYVTRAVIPERLYGPAPVEPVGTVAVEALLLTRADLPADVVRALTQALFHSKVEIARHHVVATQMSERVEDAKLRYPLHEGASAYYRRDDPPFLVAYAEAISLVITLAVGASSALLGLREWVRRAKKNRIDVYYVEIDELTRQLQGGLSMDELSTLKSQLIRLRRRAFEDLVRERLLADESFTIFQDLLRTELDEIDRALKVKQVELGLTDSGQFRRSDSGSGNFRRVQPNPLS